MSTAFDFLFSKLGHEETVQFGVRIISDALYKVRDTCPSVVLGLCDKCINIFNKLKEETERECADQLKECRATGICASHREGVGSIVHSIIQDVMDIKLDKDGSVIRASLPDSMTEDIKDMLCSGVGKLKTVVKELRAAKTHEERIALVELFRTSILESADTLAN